MTTLDELLATSPLPWTSLKGIAFDCNGAIVPTSYGPVTEDVNALLVEAVNRIGELQAERDESRRERDGFEGMLAPKVYSYGGDATEYFDRVVANHPLPWTGSIDGMIKDSAGGGFAIFCSEFMRLFLPAINSIVSLRAERDSLQSKVEELERLLEHNGKEYGKLLEINSGLHADKVNLEREKAYWVKIREPELRESQESLEKTADNLRSYLAIFQAAIDCNYKQIGILMDLLRAKPVGEVAK